MCPIQIFTFAKKKKRSLVWEWNKKEQERLVFPILFSIYHRYRKWYFFFPPWIQPAGPGDSYHYQKLERTDLPGEHDYNCPRSLVSWGCMLSIQTLAEAYRRCSGDPQCRAMVVTHSKTSNGKKMYLFFKFLCVCENMGWGVHFHSWTKNADYKCRIHYSAMMCKSKSGLGLDLDLSLIFIENVLDLDLTWIF